MSGQQDCYNCGQTGHISRNCTEARRPRENTGPGFGPPRGSCYRCGKTGHWARDCTLPDNRTPESGGPLCYNCQKPGHIARDCSQARKPQVCYKCQKEGHIARDCTAAPQE
mmetsp:Transcript_26924/g.45125  ORF Transcript_26924/g.45125 Transcript_26924/m.45125 type:complete len:111 (+) Transcript_26924:91-423(+)